MQNTKEVLKLLALLGKLVVDRLKDGVQLDDALAIGTALLADPKLRPALDAAIKDIDKVPDEFKDFDLLKGLELVNMIPELIAILELNKKA